MTDAFVFFVGRSLRNRLTRQLRRLRSPRYAIAGVVGLAYFILVFGSWGAGSAGDTWTDVGRLAGPLALALFAAWWWLRGRRHHGIILSPAETHLLLPAPLTRGRIIAFRIMQAQPALIFSALLATLVTRGAGLPWPLRFASLWVMFATLHQHQIAASLVHASAEQHGLRRNAVPIAIFATAFVVLAWPLVGALADLRAAGSAAAVAERLGALLDEPGPRIVLAPFRLLVAPSVAPSAAAWAVPFAGALVLLVAHFLWVIRTDAAFEEAAAAEGARRHALSAAVRAGGLSRARLAARNRERNVARPWLPLRQTGTNAWAILWKNVLYVQRSMGSLRAMLAVLALMAIIIAVDAPGGAGPLSDVISSLLLTAAGAITLFGPLAVRNDLRLDLRHIEALRTYPVRSRDLVAAEAAAAVLVLTVTQFILAGVGMLVLAYDGGIAIGTATLVIGAALLALPVVNTLAVLIQNALALLYPSWMHPGEHGAGGVEAVGQNMIVMVGTLLLLLLCAIPPVVAGALVGAPLVMVFGQTALAAGFAVGVIAAMGEAVLITLWLGRLYDRTDPVTAGLLR